MRLFLAPMEGVVDHHLRALLTALGGIDICVTEFARVNDVALPKRVFKRLSPELEHHAQTASDTPVRVQLLGSNPDTLAQSALTAVAAGAKHIDLNFGCPAKTVNKNKGGAILLREPELVYRIVHSVRQALPSHIPLSAKTRLGFDDRSLYLDNAIAVAEAGAAELCVHARSRMDGYKPPAYWSYISPIREALSIPVVANGEIWSVDDWQRCRAETGCDDFMLGRGLLSRPDLAKQIKAAQQGIDNTPYTWLQVCQLLFEFYITTREAYDRRYLGSRAKQWLYYLSRSYPEASVFFNDLKRLKDDEAIQQLFYQQGVIEQRD